MRTHVALLRGVNVVGRNTVSMAELREVVAALGHREVTTYIQSGNVVFAAADTGTTGGEIADEMAEAIAARLAVRASVVVLSRAELEEAVRDSPYPADLDPKVLHGVFLPEIPSPEGVASVVSAVERARAKGSRDDARVVGRTLYLWTPDGFARSVLRAELDRGGTLRTPMRVGTARNWATANALLALFES